MAYYTILNFNTWTCPLSSNFVYVAFLSTGTETGDRINKILTFGKLTIHKDYPNVRTVLILRFGLYLKLICRTYPSNKNLHIIFVYTEDMLAETQNELFSQDKIVSQAVSGCYDGVGVEDCSPAYKRWTISTIDRDGHHPRPVARNRFAAI